MSGRAYEGLRRGPERDAAIRRLAEAGDDAVEIAVKLSMTRPGVEAAFRRLGIAAPPREPVPPRAKARSIVGGPGTAGPTPPETRPCAYGGCGETFEVTAHRKLYCSAACRNRAAVDRFQERRDAGLPTGGGVALASDGCAAPQLAPHPAVDFSHMDVVVRRTGLARLRHGGAFAPARGAPSSLSQFA